MREGTGLVEVRAIDPGRYQASQQVKSRNEDIERQTEVAESAVVVGEQQAVYIEEIDVVTNDNAHSNSDPKVFVQVGAFGQLENANQLRNQLTGLNLGEVSISSIVQNAKQLHRVRIGPLASVESADQTITQLNEMGMQDHRVVIE